MFKGVLKLGSACFAIWTAGALVALCPDSWAQESEQKNIPGPDIPANVKSVVMPIYPKVSPTAVTESSEHYQNVKEALDHLYRKTHSPDYHKCTDLTFLLAGLTPQQLQSILTIVQQALDQQAMEMQKENLLNEKLQMELVRKWEAGEDQDQLTPDLRLISNAARLSRDIDSLLKSNRLADVTDQQIKALIQKRFGDANDPAGKGFAANDIINYAYAIRNDENVIEFEALIKLAGQLEGESL